MANDNKEQIDFSKAFDTVPCHHLLVTLNHYRIRGKTYNWIKEFLTNRDQRVVFEGEYSKSVHVDLGVPQGIVLGPLLFLLYINYLPDHVNSQVHLFADDCLMYHSINSDSSHNDLQQDL